MVDIDLLCVGAASYDLVFEVDHHPLPDEKTVARSFARCGGGPAANASVMAARMGLRAAFAGYLGRELFGELHLEELRLAGVSTEWIVRGDVTTPLSTVWVKPSGERALVNYRSADAPLPPGTIDFSSIRPRVILFDGHEPAISAPLLERARASGIETVLDAGSLHRGTALLYERVGHLVASETFALEATGAADPGAALEILALRHPCVVITRGSEGLIWAREGRRGSLPAFAVEARDTTGAGDVFHGAYAGCLAQARGWEETLRYASAAAALACTRLGARRGIPEGAEVARFLAERS